MSAVLLNTTALAALAASEDVKAALDRVGEQVADRAAQAAPKASGAGAASIHHVVGVDGDGAYAHVSWDRDHFYLGFHEFGTSRMSARPFLRPALDAQYNL